MEKMMSKKDVFVCRGIWYVMTLLSICGLYISFNLLWPAGGKSTSSFRDGAVSATTFYAVTLFRYLFFSHSPSPCYKVLTTIEDVYIQAVVSSLALGLLMTPPLLIYEGVTKNVSVLAMLLFTISLFTGGIGLIQLSDKLRMEMRYALITLFLGWLFCLSGIYICSYNPHTPRLAFALCSGCQWMLSVCFFISYYVDEDLVNKVNNPRLPV